MPLTDDDLSVLYRELTGSRTDRGACPASDTLARVAAGDLESTERDGVAAHIEICQTCAQDFRIACGLQAKVAPQQTAGRTSRFWTWTPLPQALAASLAIVSVGLVAWNVRLQQRAADLESRLDRAVTGAEVSPGITAPSAVPPAPAMQAYVNVPIIDLEPPSRVRGEGSSRQIIRLASDAAFVTLIVNTEAERRSTDYTLDLLDPRDTTLWTGTGLRPGSDGTLSVALPATLLRPGDYVFSLTETSTRRLLHRYPVTIALR